MSDNKPKIPKSLADALKAGNVVPFVGAGVSMSVKRKNEDGTESDKSLFPSWKGFVEILAQALRDEHKNEDADYVLSSVNIPKPKYLEALQHAKEELNGTLWHQLFEESFSKSKDEAYPDSFRLNELIWKLANNLIITTNVDRVFQWLCPKPSEFTILDVQTVEYAKLRIEKVPKRPTVWHLHGHIDNKDKVIFTREQFNDFYKQSGNEAKLQTLFDTLTERPIIFIGFSLDDAYLREILENIRKTYKDGAGNFYILFRERDIPSANFPKYVTPIPFSDFGKPLEDLVDELARIADDNDHEEKDNSQIEPQKPDNSAEKERLRNHYNVPFAAKGDGFVGREGLREKIWETLSKDRRAAIGQAVAIEGFGGLGKTQLAVEYAHTYRNRYENGVYWLTADGDMSVQLIKIGESLHWISQSDTGFDQAELVRNRFRKLSDCLIIFDNVDDQEAIKNYLPEVGYQPHILVTSREEQHGFHPINLDTLSESEARELIVQTAERSPETEAEEKALEDILKELDGLPLAVELVGGYLLRRKSITFQNYLEYLENEPIERIEQKFANNPFTKRDKSIIRALKISERLLNETEYLEDILDILAWSGKSSMGYSFLQKLIETKDNLALKDALGVALELHFIKKKDNEERYAIHRLLAKVRQFEKPLKDRKDWHQKIVGNMVEWFRQRKDKFEFLKEFEAETIHLQQWRSQSSDVLPTEIVYLTNFEAYPLWHRGNYQESQIFLENALSLYKQNELIDERLLSNLYNDLGVIIGNLGNSRQAFEFQQKALSIGQSAFDKKNEDIAKFLDNLGNTYGYLGNHLKALELIQQSFEIRRDIFGENHPDVATSLSNLGLVYGTLGNHLKALELQKQALEITQELFDEKHPNVATALNNLGGTYGNLGNHQKALELQKQALEIRQELFGDKHPAVAMSLNNLGGTYGDLGNHQKALELQKQALEIRQELFGDKHPAVAMSLNNLGLAYGNLGNHLKALELQKQALEITQELFGEKHPNVATSLNNLGLAYGNLGNHQKAIEHYEKALVINREILGNQHPATILFCKNLIFELVKTGYREKAGRLAGEFLSYVPQDNAFRPIFEEYGAMYRKAKQRKKKQRH